MLNKKSEILNDEHKKIVYNPIDELEREIS
jgi:hypothetical protein